MKKHFLILLVILSVKLLAQDNKEQNQKIIENKNPTSFSLQKINYPGDTNIDILYYKLNLAIDSSSGFIQGAVTVTAQSLSDGLNSFFLDLTNSLTIDSILSNKTKVVYVHNNDNTVQISLNNPLSVGQKFSIIVYYHGIPPQTGFGSYIVSKHNNYPIIWTLSEPYGARDWWPCKDTPGDKADSSDVWITCSSFFKVASNGILTEIKNNKNGTMTWKWKNRYPIAHYLISFAMTNYIEYKEYFHYVPGDSMLVDNYIYPENFNQNTIDQLKLTIDMLTIYSDIFGPYPWLDEKYGHAQFGWGGGMEHQTIASVVNFGEELIAHELAHQWYGDKITCKDWQDIWLNEGFATYAVALYYEKKYGQFRYNNYMYTQFLKANHAQGSIYVQNIQSVGEIFDGLRSYAKGAVVLHMLRGVVGDSAFFKILKDYTADPSVAYGVVTTEDFQRIAESVSGLDLHYFFNEWIYGENYPNYNVTWEYSDLGNNSSKVVLNVNQITNTNPVFFTMPVQIKIFVGTKDTLINIFNDKQNQEFEFIIAGRPDSVQFDPDNRILKNVAFTTSVGINTFPIDFKLQQNYPNPFNPSTIISFQIPADGFITLRVFDILGNLVAILLNEERKAGRYNYVFSNSGYQLPSGIYFYQMVSGNFKQVRKMMLLK
jgi:aminopeptidase N